MNGRFLLELTLVTRDDHFREVHGLQVEHW
jgi:hypothetical protein